MKATAATERLPIASLLALAAAAFITILTEALPAGLLPQMAQSLAVSEAWVGQTITLYALGSLVAAIPLTALTQGVRRCVLLLVALACFVFANSLTAVASHYWLTAVARVVAGMAAGLLWALLAGYAARMVPEQLRGRAIAIAMLGAPLALSLGVPLGTALGQALGWRMSFGVMSVMALLLMLWVRFNVPDFAGQASAKRLPLRQVFVLEGIRPVLFVVLVFVLAHNIIYTYIAPFLQASGMAERVDLVLLVFGVASLLGIWAVGAFIDRHLRALSLASALLFMAAAVSLWIAPGTPWVVYAAVAIWGLSFGGAGALLQTALANTAGDAADVAQSMLVTAWNIAIAGGGIIGGLLLEGFGVATFAPVLTLLLCAVLAVVWRAKHHGFSNL